MRGFAWFVGVACGAIAGVLVWHSGRNVSVPELAHRLEDAWADHHTVA